MSQQNNPCTRGDCTMNRQLAESFLSAKAMEPPLPIILQGDAAETHRLRAQLTALLERLGPAMKEVGKLWPKFPACRHPEWEPDTCMTIMQCELCGVPFHLCALLDAPTGNGEKEGEDGDRK